MLGVFREAAAVLGSPAHPGTPTQPSAPSTPTRPISECKSPYTCFDISVCNKYIFQLCQGLLKPQRSQQISYCRIAYHGDIKGLKKHR